MPNPTEPEHGFDGDYARDTHRGGLGDNYARDTGWSGAGRADDYIREEHDETRNDHHDHSDVTIGKASE